MTQHFASLAGRRASRVIVHVGNRGPWFADIDLDDPAPLPAGRIVLQLGDLQLVGTVVPQYDGVFGEQRRTRIVAGGAGWSSVVAATGYHNDAGVKARLIADDAARAVGETIGTFIPAAERVGVDYARQNAVASRALDDACGPDVAWWVDYDGMTHCGPRPATPLDESQYNVLAYDPRSRIVTLAVDDPGAVRIGSILSSGLDGARAVRELDLRVMSDELRVVAWLGGSTVEPDRLVGILRSIAQRATDGRLYGVYRYRVVRQVGERVEAQAVRQRAGLPDLGPLSAWPGVPGAYPELTPGGEVLVQFLEGDRAQPIIVGYAGPGAPGFEPVHLTIGGAAGSPAARSGDHVEVLLPPAVFTGNVLVSGVPSPATGVLTWAVPKALGVIVSGSEKVSVSP